MSDTDRQVTNERHQALLIGVLTLAALALTSIALLAIGSSLGGLDLDMISNPARWLTELDTDAAFATLSNTAEVLAGVLAVAITVVAIVVELAATRYSHRITRLFITEPVNVGVLALFVLTTVQCVWVAATFEKSGQAALLPNAGFGITMLLVTLSLLVLLPYFYFVISFISPLSIIQKLRNNAYRYLRKTHDHNVPRMQRATLVAIDELQDVGRSAVDQSDTRIAMATVDALAELLLDYLKVRGELPDRWFEIDNTISRDPDFVSLAPSALDEIREAGLWFEVKVMRQYLSLVNQTVPHARDVANVIAINTERIGIAAGEVNPGLLTLCIRCFNSYLRTAIRASDPRTASYVMNQYRRLAEALLNQRQFDAVKEIGEHFRYYATFSHSLGESFLLEVAAHDIIQLIEEAVRRNSPIVDDLIELLLDLDQEIRSESQADSLLSVRRAQMKLATFFLELGDNVRVSRIVEDLKDEKIERLEAIRDALLGEQRPHYWEFTDRGVNFSYLAPERRRFLEPLLELVAPGRQRFWDETRNV